LHGLSPTAAAAAHEAPAAAINVAQSMPHGGEALAAAARDAFMVGSRYAMYMGAALLLVGAVFVFVRGQRQVESIVEDDLDMEPSDDADYDVELAPAS
jgi:hypothetical protein